MIRKIEPVVTSPSGKQRRGKGFSLTEIFGAGITRDIAHRLHIPIDNRRSSIREENVVAIKNLLASEKVAEPARKKISEKIKPEPKEGRIVEVKEEEPKKKIAARKVAQKKKKEKETKVEGARKEAKKTKTRKTAAKKARLKISKKKE